MTHREKVDYFIADMRRRGVGEYTAAPPLYRLYWLLGMKIPPPHFQTYLSLANTSRIFFGGLMGLWAYLLYRDKGMTLAVAGLGGLLAGAFFGFTLAAYYRWSARRLNLPSWEQYPSLEPDFATDRHDEREVE